MREYIFTRNEIKKIKQFHQDGRKTQAIRLLKHRCEGQKAELEEHIQILDDFLNDYASPEPECFGSEDVLIVDEIYKEKCLMCCAEAKCLVEHMSRQGVPK